MKTFHFKIKLNIRDEWNEMLALLCVNSRECLLSKELPILLFGWVFVCFGGICFKVTTFFRIQSNAIRILATASIYYLKNNQVCRPSLNSFVMPPLSLIEFCYVCKCCCFCYMCLIIKLPLFV